MRAPSSPCRPATNPCLIKKMTSRRDVTTILKTFIQNMNNNEKKNVWSILIKVIIAALSALTGAIAGNAMINAF